MSASSLFVTCGIMTQLRCRFAPEIFLMRESGFGSTGPNFVKSIFGHGSRFNSPPPAAAGAAAPAGAARWPVMTPLMNAVTSACVMRPFGPVPCTCVTSTPSSRANLRTDGEAWLGCRAPPSPAGITGACASADGEAGAGDGVTGASDGFSVCCFGAAAGAGAGAAAAPSASTTTMTEPSETVSPTLTFTSLTTPAAELGTSIVALSDSSVTSDCSFSTRSPTFTATSITGMSL